MEKKYKKHNLTKSKLENLYHEQLLSDREIGENYSLTGEAIAYYRKKFNIKTLSASERISANAKKNGLIDINQISDKKLKDLYLRYGANKLGEMCGCSKIKIKSRLKIANIKMIDKKTRARMRCPNGLNIIQEQLIFGSLLGDGGIWVNDIGDAASFYESHGIKQIEYLKWKKNILSSYIFGELSDDNKKLDDGRVAYGYRLKTCCHPVFLEYHNMFYYNSSRNKLMPNDFEEKINPFSLAIWYQDDGNLGLTHSDSENGGRYTIASGYSEDSIKYIVKILKNKFGLKVDYSVREGVCIMKILSPDIFEELISRYIHISMRYKLRKNCRVKLSGINVDDLFCKDIKTMNEHQLNSHVEILADYWLSIGFPIIKLSDFSKNKREEELRKISASNIDLNKNINSGHTFGSSYCLSNFDNFWKVKRYGKKSPWEVFHNKDILKHAIRDCYKYRGKVTEVLLRQELQTFGGCHNFRPSIAKAIYDKYGGNGSVLDCCSGFGGRLLGFYASNKVNKYVGVDVESETIKGLKHMNKILNRSISKDVFIHYSAFEDLYLDEKFDLVFTSPPYFKKELYSLDKKQSCEKYNNYEEWLNGFLFTLIDKSFDCLVDGGYFIINIADVKIGKKQYNLTNDFFDYANNIFEYIDTHWMVNRSMYSKLINKEPIYVFQKSSR